MSLMFNRFVEVTFQNAGIKIGGRAVHNTRLELPPAIKFSVTHNSESTPNSAEVTFLNLTAETQRQIMVENEIISIEAGYWPQGGSRNTEVIFTGQVRTAFTNIKNGTDVHSTIRAGDSDDAYTNARIAKVFGTSQDAVVAEAVARFGDYGVSRGYVEPVGFDEERPRTVERLARKELDDLAYQHDMLWHIQDGQFHMYHRDNVLASTAYVLSPNTGLIDSPQFSDKGVNVRTMMIGDLRPGHTFQIESKVNPDRVREECKIESISFAGDNFLGPFGAVIDAKFLEGGSVVRARQRLLGQVT